jgi:CO/xanthine dehydrogenase FAD-binding subunit
MQRFQFHSPKSIAEALRFLSKGTARIVAGGTDLIPRLRENFRPEFVVNILEIEELQGIREVQGDYASGRHDSHPGSGIRICRDYPSLAQEAASVGGLIRNRGTIGEILPTPRPPRILLRPFWP